MRIAQLLAVGGFVFGTLTGLAHADQRAVVACHDRDRGLVQDVERVSCAGRIVAPPEARRLRDLSRDARVRQFRDLSPGPGPAGADRRGSGFRIDTAGHVLTARHVVAGCARVTVLGAGGDLEPAEVVGVHAHMDAALLRTSPARSAPTDVQPDAMGDYSAAIRIVGYGSGNARVPRTLEGRVAQSPKVKPGSGALVFHAPVGPGNSGAPILTGRGRVIGMVTGRFATAGQPPVHRGDRLRVGVGLTATALTGFLADQGVGLPQDRLNLASPKAAVVRVLCALPKRWAPAGTRR